MNNGTTLFCGALIGTLMVLSPDVARTDEHNLLQDAGFENKLSAEQGGWQLFEVSLYSDDQARSGGQSIFNGGMSRTVAYHPYFVGVVSGSYQEFPAEPGSRWRLTGYGLAATPLQGTPAFGIVQVSFFDAEGEDLGTVETAETDGPRAKTSNEVNSKTPVDEWTFLDTGIATAPAGTAVVQAFTLYVDYSGTNNSQGVFFDDLTLCSIGDANAGRCASQ